MQLLHISSSPRHAGSASKELADAFVRNLKNRLRNLSVVHRDLTLDPPPPIDQAWANAMFMPPEDHTEEMRHSLEPSETYIRELHEADSYLFSMPMHNFTVPANFKAWIDHSLRPGRTFAIRPQGTEGLLTGRRAIVISSRGGYYHTADPKSDFQEPYMRKIFSFIGVRDVTFVHAEGLDMGPEAKENGLRQAAAQLEHQARRWSAETE